MQGWWGKDESKVPEALRSLTPEQIVEQLKAAAEAKTKAAELEAKLQESTTAQQTFKTELDSTKQRLAEIELNSRKPPAREPESIPSIVEDEEAAFNARLSPLRAGILANAAQNALIVARQRISTNPVDAAVLKKYGKEVDQLYETVPFESRASEMAYINCFKIVKSDHFDELHTELQKESGGLFSEPVGGGKPPEQNVTKEEKLSPEEERIAKRFGMTTEQYLAQRKGMNYVGA